MKIIIILICVSLSIAVGFLLLFLWSVRSGQYDDVYTPAVRMLFDDRKKAVGPQADNAESLHQKKSDLSQRSDVRTRPEGPDSERS